MNNSAERLSQKKWGVFTHYLHSIVCDVNSPSNKNTGITDWNTAVNSIDVERLAYSLHKMNVGYYFITLMQGTKYMIAPNSTFDSIAGTLPGQACSERDLPLELAEALAKYDIDLCLYYTGDGPWTDNDIGKRFGFTAPRENVSLDFVSKWSSVLEEFALRYKDKVKAWWIDGCCSGPADFRNEQFGYTDELLSYYYKAIKKGNPNAAVTFNNGVCPTIKKYTSMEDFTAGEFRGLNYKIPQTKYIDGALHHILFPLGYPKDFSRAGWATDGVKYSHECLLAYIKQMNALGGAVTIDIQPFIDGSFNPEQEKFLQEIGDNL